MGWTGPLKSAADSRLTCLPAVSAISMPAGRCSSTTAIPARRPAVTWMMSPRRNASSERAVSARRSADRSLASRPSRSDNSARIRAYPATSPRSQLICAATRSSSSRPSRAWRARPATARSAWNWANEDSSRVAALARPNCPVRFTAML